ncbi:MAG: hypothetical protein QOD38_1790, partial [Acidimicrobiaceae bacterium]
MSKAVRRTFLPGVLVAILLLTASAPSADASSSLAGGHPIATIAAQTSSNWAGYNQGILEPGKAGGFNQVSGQWVVTAATQHKAGRAEHSATWLGIGGGCLNTSCLAGDATLIQAGSSQDVAANGKTSYSVWYELIPGPSITIPNLPVKPGDTVFVGIRQLAPYSDLWVINVKVNGRGFSTTLPYSSTHATVEWIVETPLVIGTGGTGVAAMPNLTTTQFAGLKVNNAPARLTPAEQINLVSGGQRLATPSAPHGAGFNVCTYTTT